MYSHLVDYISYKISWQRIISIKCMAAITQLLSSDILVVTKHNECAISALVMLLLYEHVRCWWILFINKITPNKYRWERTVSIHWQPTIDHHHHSAVDEWTFSSLYFIHDSHFNSRAVNTASYVSGEWHIPPEHFTNLTISGCINSWNICVNIVSKMADKPEVHFQIPLWKNVCAVI